jgi:2-iminobutanoate/2-iminopropanoate deaminase
MSRDIVEVPVLSEAVRRLGIPMSLVTRGAGLVFVSALPPLDVASGKTATGGTVKQTTACLDALSHCLAAAGSSLDKLLMVRIYAPYIVFKTGKIEKTYAAYFPVDPPARTYVTVGDAARFPLQIEGIALA